MGVGHQTNPENKRASVAIRNIIINKENLLTREIA